MNTQQIDIGDGQLYEVPDAVVERMAAYYKAMETMAVKLRVYKEKKRIAKLRPCKDTRMDAWMAEKELINLI